MAVTIKPVHSLVAAIMEGAGTPALIVEGQASPHTFALKPSSARAIEAADLFVRVSPAVEPFTT
ncbi:metal ABC transporter solute-binding protein, Zn/Mn family, partial [Staphylococcus aureus]